MTTGYLVVSGVVLGVLQLLAGLGIGLWVGRVRGRGAATSEDSDRAMELAEQLRSLTAGLNSQARKQADMLSSADSRLQSESLTKELSGSDSQITELVTGIVREMISANLELQEKLANSEMEIEAMAAAMAEHREQAMTDPLTGLLNRRALDDQLHRRLEAWRTHRTPFSVLLIDVDHFKRFNDTHGHAAGDKALQVVGQALTNALRQHDVVTRYGGEEFAIVLPHTTLESSQAASRKAIAAISEALIPLDDQQTSVTASGGLASMQSAERVEDLLQRADQALYAAKDNGRNQAWMHDGEELQPLLEHQQEAADGAGELLATPLAEATLELRQWVNEYLAD